MWICVVVVLVVVGPGFNSHLKMRRALCIKSGS